MQPADILEKAADFLEGTGWTQNQTFDTIDGEIVGACLSGACWLGASGLTEQDVITQADEWGVRRVDDDGRVIGGLAILPLAWSAIEKAQHDPVNWNDAPERTAAEVIDLLKATAKDLRNNAKPEELS